MAIFLTVILLSNVLIARVGFSCKSRFCTSCGKIYTQNCAFKLKEEFLNVPHVHATFSLPTGFYRNFFFHNRSKLGDLANAAHQALKYTLRKLGIHSNIHTFARDLDWNPYIHCIFTLGGYKKIINGKISNLFLTLFSKNLGKNVFWILLPIFLKLIIIRFLKIKYLYVIKNIKMDFMLTLKKN